MIRLGSLAVLLLLLISGCGVKAEYLPQVDYPYVAEMEFLKEVRNVDGKAKKKRFKEDRITSPFYFLLKIKEIENDGAITVRFYTGESPAKKGTNGENNLNKKVTEKTFQFGKPGKYYEYVIFFDHVETLSPGKYRYAVFYNDHLIYEDRLEIEVSEVR